MTGAPTGGNATAKGTTPAPEDEIQINHRGTEGTEKDRGKGSGGHIKRGKAARDGLGTALPASMIKRCLFPLQSPPRCLSPAFFRALCASVVNLYFRLREGLVMHGPSAGQWGWRRRTWGERWAGWREYALAAGAAVGVVWHCGPARVRWPFLRWWWARRLERAADPRLRGQAGEALAAAWLATQGWREVARNWRSGPSELDLIGWDGDVLVFVEVKTRAAEAEISGLGSVDRRKRRLLGRAVRAYLDTWPTRPRQWRGEIVEVTVGGAAGLQLRRYWGARWGRADDRDRRR